MLKKISLGIGVMLAILLLAFLVMFYRIARQSDDLVNAGLVNDVLQACPDRPSCVSSYASSEEHLIAAFSVPSTMNEPVAVMAAVIGGQARAEILEQNSNYLHATFKSAIFGFVDDLEVLFDGEELQVRSVSRVGYSDMGVNRARVDALREVWLSN